MRRDAHNACKDATAVAPCRAATPRRLRTRPTSRALVGSKRVGGRGARARGGPTRRDSRSGPRLCLPRAPFASAASHASQSDSDRPGPGRTPSEPSRLVPRGRPAGTAAERGRGSGAGAASPGTCRVGVSIGDPGTRPRHAGPLALHSLTAGRQVLAGRVASLVTLVAPTGSRDTEYGSSPDEQPALQIRIDRDWSAASTILGMTSPPRTFHASGSRKKPVTLMRIVLNSATCSAAC